MAHRTSDQHHIREAVRPSHLDDGNTDQSTAAYRAMLDGTYKGSRSRESGDGAANRTYVDRPADDARNSDEPTPEVVQGRVRASAMVPSVLTVACPEHDAQVGELCFKTSRGVCWRRVVARAGKR